MLYAGILPKHLREALRKVGDEVIKSLLAEYRAKLYEHAIAVREMRRKGECDGSMRPDCFSTCAHGVYCAEWQPRYNQLIDRKESL